MFYYTRNDHLESLEIQPPKAVNEKPPGGWPWAPPLVVMPGRLTLYLPGGDFSCLRTKREKEARAGLARLSR